MPPIAYSFPMLMLILCCQNNIAMIPPNLITIEAPKLELLYDLWHVEKRWRED